MKNSLKYKFIALAVVLIFIISTPAFADMPLTEQVAPNNDISYKTKQPLRKRDLALKFLLAMAGVATSSVIIYVGLSAYNKLMYEKTVRKAQNNAEDNDFKTPTNMKEALDIFLKKTK